MFKYSGFQGHVLLNFLPRQSPSQINEIISSFIGFENYPVVVIVSSLDAATENIN